MLLFQGPISNLSLLFYIRKPSKATGLTHQTLVESYILLSLVYFLHRYLLLLSAPENSMQKCRRSFPFLFFLVCEYAYISLCFMHAQVKEGHQYLPHFGVRFHSSLSSFWLGYSGSHQVLAVFLCSFQSVSITRK